MKNLKYCMKVDSTAVLGPYNRAAIWVHGCHKDCPDCLATSFKGEAYLMDSVKKLANWFNSLENINDLTISGGEPMLQAEALTELIDLIKKEKDVGVVVYTGYTLNELRDKNSEIINTFLDKIDILIDGPYIKEKNDNKPFRGSSNQNIINLTPKYSKVIKEYYSQEGRPVEIKFLKDKTIMIGVPSIDEEKLWRKLEKEGK